MTELFDFVQRVSGFSGKTYTEKIEIFAWYLHEVAARSKISPADLLRCFDLAHCERPANIYGLLQKQCEKKPARILKDGQGYRLAASIRESVGKQIGLRASTIATTALLASLIPRVTNQSQQRFLNETLICFNHKSYRAAIVMAWNLAYSHVCDRVFDSHTVAFNSQRSKIYPKLPELVKRTDFEDYRESQVIEICRGARLLDASVCKVLTEKLGRRNLAAHPSSTTLTAVSAEDAIMDLVTNVLLNPAV